MQGIRRITATGLAVLIGATSMAACGSSSSSGKGKVAVDTSGADFGTMKNVCHKAKTPNSSAKQRGVTATSIKLTAVSDANSTIQKGLNQELWDASTVFTQWCNAHGGINGRTIQLAKGDAQITQYPQVVNDACTSSFALVGGGAAFDNTAQEARVKCLLPDFPAFVTSSTARGSSLVYQPLPLSNTQFTTGMIQYISKKYPTTLDHIGYLYGNFSAPIMAKEQVRKSAEGHYGWKHPVYEMNYPPVGVTNWAPYAQKLAGSGAQGLIFNGQPPDLAKMLNAVKAIGYTGLKWVYSDSNMYDETLVTQGATALDATNVYVQLLITPFENAEKKLPGSEATQKYLALFKQYLPNGKVRALLGVQSFAAWLLFVQAANACGANLDTKCVTEQTTKVHSFDAGGLTAPSDPGQGSVSQCFAGVQITSKGFSILNVGANNGPFNCSPANRVNLPNFDFQQYGKPVSLGDVGKSLDDLP